MDDSTRTVYAARAADYADLVAEEKPSRALRAFLGSVPKGADLLDLGCGPGQAAAQMAAAGHRVTATDGSAEMVALANARFGIGARVETFDDLAAVTAFDGVWANFSLTHAPRADLPRHLASIARALRPGGVLHIGMKTGETEGRDALGRFYGYLPVPMLANWIEGAGFAILDTVEGAEAGLAGTVEPYVQILARLRIERLADG